MCSVRAADQARVGSPGNQAHWLHTNVSPASNLSATRTSDVFTPGLKKNRVGECWTCQPSLPHMVNLFCHPASNQHQMGEKDPRPINNSHWGWGSKLPGTCRRRCPIWSQGSHGPTWPPPSPTAKASHSLLQCCWLLSKPKQAKDSANLLLNPPLMFLLLFVLVLVMAWVFLNCPSKLVFLTWTG